MIKCHTVGVVGFETGTVSIAVVFGWVDNTGGATLELPQVTDAGGIVGIEFELSRLAWSMAKEIEIASVCALNFSR